MTKGKLFLIPVHIAEGALSVIPQQVIQAIRPIEYFVAEDIRTARRYLSSLKLYSSIETLNFQVLNKDTQERELEGILKPLADGKDVGVLSESGCPGVADPGALAVRYAHKLGVQVIPLVGPSSLLLALMASGLNGQQFAFHGYLPVDSKELTQKIKDLERESKAKNQTQLFIETPYRNNSLFEQLVKTLQADTWLTVAIDLTGAEESIQTRKVSQWKKHSVQWPKIPAVFLLLA